MFKGFAARSKGPKFKESDQEDWMWYEVHPDPRHNSLSNHWFPSRDPAGDERPVYSPEPFVQFFK